MTRLLTINLLLASWLAITLALGESVRLPAAETPPPSSPPTTPGVVAPSPPPPADPFQRCALRVLAGEFGEVEEWKLEAYRRGLEAGVTVRPGKLLMTHYGPWDGVKGSQAWRDGTWDRRGRRCSTRTLGSNFLPENSYVWLCWRTGGATLTELRQVRDCGARGNDPVARRLGADCWVDRWTERRLQATYWPRYAVIPKEERP